MLRQIPANCWVILPMYNEALYIGAVLSKIQKFTNQIVVVDDGSTDQAALLVKQTGSQVLIHSVNLGKGAALKTGCEYAFDHLKAEKVVILDSDDQHDPSFIPHFFQKLDQTPIVLGTRQMDRHMPILRRLGNRLLSWLVQLLFGTYIPDILSGYKAFTKSAYKKVSWESTAYGVETEISIRIAQQKIPFSVVHIPTIYHDFNRGMTLFDTFEIIAQIISWRFTL